MVWALAHGTVASGQIGDGTTVQPAAAIAISDPAYAWKVSTPTFSPGSGTYNVTKTVTVTALTSAVTIHYTLDGNEPTASDPVVASGSTVTIDVSRTLKAKAWKTGFPTSNTATAIYTLQVVQPSTSPTPTTYTVPQTVTMSTSTSGATIRYTTDGTTTPTESSTAYTGPLSVSTRTPFKIIAFKSGWSPSTMAQPLYQFNYGTLAAPTFDPAGGTYTSQTTVTMTALAGATIHYTTDGSLPGTGSPTYMGPVPVSTSQTLKARAFHDDWTTSGTTTASYTINVATPTMTPTSGTYNSGQTITVSDATADATIRYTLNGVDPTSSDAIIASGGALLVGNYTLKAKAFKPNATTSATATATYHVTGDLTIPRVVGGGDSSYAVRSDGVLFAWGNNTYGQLGTGNTTRQLLPSVVNGLTGAIRVGAGSVHALAIDSSQQSWSWGNNGNGRLGDGSTNSHSLPAVAGASTVVALVGQYAHTLALKANGTLVAWGANASGQLGDGTTTDSTTAVNVGSLTNVTAMVGGNAFSLAVTSNGTAWSWGVNGNGQLGTGNTSNRSTPGTVSGITTAVAVAAGQFHSLAVLSDGTVRAWGYNNVGQLGDGSLQQRNSPVAVSTLTNIVAIAAGDSHSLALDASGAVWAWGNNFNGQVGDGTQTNRSAPVSVSGLPAIAAISAGSQHSLAVGVDGSVWTWGRNNEGQLGDGTQTNRLSPVKIADANMAWKVAPPAFSVGSGLFYATFNVAITESDADSTLYYTTNGASPTESDTAIASGGTVAITQTTTLKARAFKAGAVTSDVTTATYELKVVTPAFSPTSGNYGSAQSVSISTTTSGASLTYTTDGTEPTSSSTAYSSAIQVSDTRTVKARGFKTGWTASDSGLASYWIPAGTVATPTITPGSGTYPSLTLATLSTTTSGSTIRYTLDGSNPTSASTAYRVPFVITASMTIKAKAFLAGYTSSGVASATWTVGSGGQSATPMISPGGGWYDAQQTVTVSATAGATVRYTLTGVDPTTSDPVVPMGGITIDRSRLLKVRSWENGLTPSAVARADFAVTGAVASGFVHSLVLTADGVLWAWGDNGSGQVGDGTTQIRTTPVQVLTSVASIAAGRYFTLAVKRDGTVWRWGANTGATPTQVSGLSNIVAVAAGSDHQLALKSDGTVWAWGDNTSGQLGDGTTNTHWTPAQVIGLAGVRSIAAGDDFSLAVEDDGSASGWVWAWGKNSDGQLADGTTLARTVPARIAGLSGVAQVAAGDAFALARLADGTVRSWGKNDLGQLGVGSSAALVPGIQRVEPLIGIRSISASSFHGMATDVDGRLWAWGYALYSQLGVPPQTPALSPLLVTQMPASLAAAGGYMHTIVLRADGTVWAMGQGSPTVPGSAMLGAQVASLSTGDQSVLTADQDSDGLLTWRELARGTDPLNADSNGNGLTDLVEIDRAYAGANADEDGDGLSSAAELLQGTDPFLADTDGDGYNDKVDAFPLDPTRHDPLTPTGGDTTPPVITLTEPTNAIPLN